MKEMTLMSQEMRQYAKQYWRHGFEEACRIEEAHQKQTIQDNDITRYKEIADKIAELMQLREAQKGSTENSIMAFRAFKRKGISKRIFSRKLDREIILFSNPVQRLQYRHEHPDETITMYTCDEVIFLLKKGYDITILRNVDQVMDKLQGEITNAEH